MTTTTNTRQLVPTRPSDYFGAGNSLLLCLDAEERLLHHFFLTQQDISVSPFVIQACMIFAKGSGASLLVHVHQTHQVSKSDPATRVLRQFARFYGLRFVEANPSEFTQFSIVIS